MKRTVLYVVLGITASLSTVASSYGQGRFNLNNYADTGNLITYNGGPFNGRGILNGNPSGINWTVGFYYALGDVRASIAPDPTGEADPFTLGGGLVFASGAPGDTTTINNTFGTPTPGGYFSTTADAIVNGWSSGAVTLEMVVYSGASYGASDFRAHSTSFLITPIASTSEQISPLIGSVMPEFSVIIMPEPSIAALGAMGLGTLYISRRRLTFR